MYYIKSSSTDPALNLALEQYLFDVLGETADICMLWQNDRAVIVGKHQNTFAEVDQTFADEYGIRVVRRLSGGGAVYHDLENLNFTFISSHIGNGTFDFSIFCYPIVRTLRELGVPAELNGRNDITICGKKFSGNSQYIKRGRVMHHGTILFDSDLAIVEKVLTVPKDKLESKGFPSLRSRVTNVRPHLQRDMTVEGFCETLRRSLFREYRLKEYQLTEEDKRAVQALRDSVYVQWS